MLKLSLFLLALIATDISIFTGAQTQLAGPEMDPRIDWQTLSTEHFQIHFDPATETQAQKLAGISEKVWSRITQKFHWEPSFPVHLILSDSTDEPNGMAIPIPYNHIYLYAIPPADSSALDYYDDWITSLLMHEFTHTTHIDMVRGLNKIPRAVLGRFWLPNAAQQQWAIEGLAEYNETYETTKGRGRSPFVSMFLRTVTQENAFASIDKATYWNHHYPYGNTAYWYGIGFHNYLREKFGDQKIFDFSDENASSLIPAFFNFKTKNIFKKSFSRLWEEWKLEEKLKWNQLNSSYQSQIKTEALLPHLRLIGRPTWSTDGQTLYASLAENEDAKVYAFTRNSDQSTNEKWKSEVVLPSRGPHRLQFIDDHLIYSELGSTSPWKRVYDLYAYNLKTKKTKRLTRDLRARDPFAYKDSIYAVRTNAFQNSIIRIPLDLGEKEIATEGLYPSQFEILFTAPGQSSIAKPKVSHDGHYLIFSMRLENGERDLYLYDLRTGKIQSLTQDIADDSDPEFSADDQSIYFSSYRKLGQTQIPVLNIFQISLDDLRIAQITDTWSGMTMPTVSNSTVSTIMALGHYHADGFTLEVLENPKPLFTDIGTGERKNFESLPEASSWNFQKENYKIGDTLLPRFVAPFVFYTESDTLIALLTGSRDPLSFHHWSGLGYYLSTPRRPGASLSYIYNGLPWVSLFAGGAAGITNYGKVLFDNQFNQYSTDYYERNYRAFAGLGYRLWWNGQETAFSISHSLFFDNRQPLLKTPADLARGHLNLTFVGKGNFANVQLDPDRGSQWGVGTDLYWSSNIRQDVNGISPKTGSLFGFSVEYSPKGVGSDFKQFMTLLSAKTYLEFLSSNFIAARAAAGLQWFDPIYQRTFSLGGSLGEGPLSSSGRRSYNMRGLPAATLEGEGVVSASLEYRYRIFDHMPGFGTAPVWAKNLHLAIFSDGGQTFLYKNRRTISDILSNNEKKFGWDRFSFTSGAELRADTSLSYLPPITLRLGYGYLMALRGQWWLNRNQSQIYFELGTSF